jgi:hypothetical protein
MPFDLQGAGLVVEGAPAADLVVAVLQGRTRSRQQRAKPFFPPRKWHRGDGFAVEAEEIEQEKDERIALAG